MIRVLAILWVAICLPIRVAYPQAQTTARVIAGQEELTGPTVWVYDSLSFENGSSIRTNGYPLTITVLGDLTIRGEASIYSFPEGQRPAKPAKPDAAPNGRGFDPGPNSEGFGAPGPSGQPGLPGVPGTPGVDGQTPGPIVLIVVGRYNGGTLRIANAGGNGGPGGDGGNGGNGGSGGQGQRATSNLVFGGVVVGCASGPGVGGAGGVGGAAGPGAPGGAGGNGGDITVLVRGAIQGQIIARSPPGDPGRGGEPGQPGAGGQSGFGGRGAAGCEGRETERRGPPGPSGNPSSRGNDGPRGRGATIKIDPPSLQREG
jgi:hypothetical protein